QSKIAALLDKRDPSRQAVAGDTLNSNAALGTAKGRSADNSATWGAMFREQVLRCWKRPYGYVDAQQIQAEFSIKLRRTERSRQCRWRRRNPAPRSSACSRRAACARSSNARRIDCRRRSLTNGNISPRCSTAEICDEPGSAEQKTMSSQHTPANGP